MENKSYAEIMATREWQLEERQQNYTSFWASLGSFYLDGESSFPAKGCDWDHEASETVEATKGGSEGESLS